MSQEVTSLVIQAACEGIKSDNDLAWTWHANIAMAFYDQLSNECLGPNERRHKIANLAAARFMSTAFGVDVTKFDQWKAFPWAQPKQPNTEPTPEQIDSVCLSYRHDFGLLDLWEKENLRAQAVEWMKAWQKEGAKLPTI